MKEDVRQHLQEVEAGLNRVIRGKKEVIRQLLVALTAGGHVLLDDVPGVGKTTLAKALARMVALEFRRIQFTPDLLPGDLLGASIYHPKEGEFHFHPGPVFTNLLLADEINRATPRTQSALLECMCESQVSIDGALHVLQKPFWVIATQNPVEFQGTCPLPEAQLDRFAMRLDLGYPSEAEERQMLLDRAGALDPADQLPVVLSKEEIIALQEAAKEVAIEESVGEYLLKIVRATREEPRLALGASPRATLALAACARAAALLAGRDFVIPDEVRDLAIPVLAHRLIPADRSRQPGGESAAILREIVGRIRVPR